ncbi:helix-turn-helix domain-containing protein [Roseateles sp. BYS78W]
MEKCSQSIFALNAYMPSKSTPIVPTGEMPYSSLWGQVIKDERTRLAIDQGSMARALGLSQSAYSRLESGDSTMNVWQMRECARLLNLTVADLLMRVDAFELQLQQAKVEVVAEKRTNPAAALIGLAVLAMLLKA